VANDGDILLRLALKGIDPAEAEQLAGMTEDQLGGAMAGVYESLRILHAKAKAAQTDEEAQAIADQIKEVQKYGRAAEAVAKDSETNWARVAASMRDGIIVGEALFSSIEGGYEKFKHLAEEVIHVSEVYGSLKGSIEGMRLATNGQVADIDLITTRNRAMMKDLTLTDEQFADVSKAAMEYAHALGVPVKEALDGMIDGLATGRVKTLQHAGVMVDAKQAQLDFAASIGTVVGNLTDAQKLYAVQQESLRKIAERAKEAGAEEDSTATRMEKGIVSVTNAWDKLLASFGNSHALDYAAQALEGLRVIAFGLEGELEAILAMSPKTAANVAYLAGAKEFHRGSDPAQDAADEAFWKKVEMGRVQKKKPKGGGTGHTISGGEQTGFDDLMRSIEGSSSPRELSDDDKMLMDQVEKRAEEKQRKELISLSGGAASSGNAEAENRKHIQAFIKPGEDILKQSHLDKHGLMARMMFGDPGTDADPSMDFYDKVEKAGRVSTEMMADVSASAEQALAATGAVLESMIAGASSDSVQQATKKDLLALGTQWQVKALGFAAEAAGAMVFGDAPQATEALIAAAEFEAAALAAGVASRSIGSGGGSSSPVSRNAASNFGASPSGPGAGNRPALPPVNIILWPGTQADGGRIISQMQEAWSRQSGYTLPPSMVRP